MNRPDQNKPDPNLFGALVDKLLREGLYQYASETKKEAIREEVFNQKGQIPQGNFDEYAIERMIIRAERTVRYRNDRKKQQYSTLSSNESINQEIEKLERVSKFIDWKLKNLYNL